MKKVVSVVLVALMVLGLSVTAFAADGKITVAPDKTEAKAGDTVVLTVKGEGFNDVGSLAISVAVDDKLELANAGEWLLTGGYVTAPLDEQGNAVFAAEKDFSINTDLYKLSVKVKDGTAAGTYAVKVTLTLDNATSEFTANITVPSTDAPHEHKYGEWKKVDDKNHEAVCECGDKKVEAHTWDAGKVTKEATTEAEGEKTFTCTACNATMTQVIPKKTSPVTGDNAVAVVFLSTLALVAACGIVVASKKRVND